MEHQALWLALIGLAGLSAQWLAWRMKLPAILFLLIIGLLLGPATGTLDPDALLGDLLFPFVSLSVAVILFEGGLTLRLHEIRGHGAIVTLMVTVGALITWLVVGTVSWWLLGVGWEIAFLFGALVTVTGPTVIVPLLRTVRPTSKVANVLRWEGILIDPIGALFAVITFEFIVSGREEDLALWLFAKSLLIGTAIGVAAAYAFGTVLRRHWLPDYLHNIAALAVALGAFTLSDTLEHESGLVAVTIMGIMLANMKNVHIGELLHFKESLSLLLISFLFIVLAARIEPQQLELLSWNAVLILLVLMLVARPLAVFISAIGSQLNWRERALVAWIGPRGIIAAAVSALFALKLESSGYPNAELLVPLTFTIIVGTVIIQSLSAKPLARLLGVAEPSPNGVLIVGANPISMALAEALRDQDVDVLIADNSWKDVSEARMKGFRTYYGNVSSEHAEKYLDLSGIGTLFAMTARPAMNALAALNFRHSFGSSGVYSIRAPEEERTPETRRVTGEYRGLPLFAQEQSFEGLCRRLNDGAKIKTNKLTEQFDLTALTQQLDNGSTPLLAIDPEEVVYPISDWQKFVDEQEPGTGWRIMSLT